MVGEIPDVSSGSNTTFLPVDIIKTENTEFYPTHSEWAAINRPQIFVSTGASVTATTETLYTVPDNQTLFISSLWANIADDASAARGDVVIKTNIAQAKLILLSKIAQNSTNAISISYPMPIRVEGGDEVQMEVSANCKGDGGFVGWIEDKRIT